MLKQIEGYKMSEFTGRQEKLLLKVSPVQQLII